MIGIIVAEEKELIEVKKIINDIEEIKIYEKVFYKGLISNKEVVLVKSNVGKVNSARITQMMIDKFDISLVINVGTAGSINNELNIGDIVVGEKLVQYDFDVTPFGRRLGEIENVGQYIESGKNILKLFEDNVYIGVVASGDKFIVDRIEKDRIRSIFNADCIEMEGASIAQVCYLNNIPFTVIRSITDKLDGSSKIDFEEFLEYSSKRATQALKRLLENL